MAQSWESVDEQVNSVAVTEHPTPEHPTGKTLPNFLIIGVQKAGTTSIYNYLRQHPQIYMSPVKETNFLERDWDAVPLEIREKENAQRRQWGRHEMIDSIEKYARLFDGVTDEVAVGEASPNYLFHYDLSIPRIRKHVPDAKLIAVLRNPIDRAYSDYLMHIREVIGSGESLSEQIERFGDRPSFTLKKGLYYDQLKHFYEAFDPSQIRVFLYEDFSKNSVEFMKEVYTFIGVDSDFSPDVSRRSQVAAVPKNQWLNSLIRTRNPLRDTVGAVLRAVFPPETRQKLRKQLIQLNSYDKSKAPKLSEGDRQKLIEIYREDVLKLQELIQRDLSHWLS